MIFETGSKVRSCLFPFSSCSVPRFRPTVQIVRYRRWLAVASRFRQRHDPRRSTSTAPSASLARGRGRLCRATYCRAHRPHDCRYCSSSEPVCQQSALHSASLTTPTSSCPCRALCPRVALHNAADRTHTRRRLVARVPFPANTRPSLATRRCLTRPTGSANNLSSPRFCRPPLCLSRPARSAAPRASHCRLVVITHTSR